jgi:hypothetical protein
MIRSQTSPLTGDEQMRTEAYWRSMIETLLKEPVETTKKHTATRTNAKTGL